MMQIVKARLRGCVNTFTIEAMLLRTLFFPLCHTNIRCVTVEKNQTAQKQACIKGIIFFIQMVSQMGAAQTHFILATILLPIWFAAGSCSIQSHYKDA